MHGRSRLLRLTAPSGASPAPRDEPARHAAALLALQRSAGNRAVAGVLARKPILIGKDRVEVASETEEEDARRIVKLLADTYGVTLDSAKARDAVRKDKKERGRSEDQIKAIDVVPWTVMDLKDLEAGLKYFAPILGKARATSKRAGTPQELTQVGRLSHYEVDPEAQYVKEAGVVAVFHAHSAAMPDPDELVAVHEIAHAVFGDLVEDFRRKIGYWTYPTDKRHDGTVEAPPTKYGATSPDEDLADSVALYFTAPDFLKSGQKGKKRGEIGNACRKRYEWIKKEVASWQGKTKKAGAK